MNSIMFILLFIVLAAVLIFAYQVKLHNRADEDPYKALRGEPPEDIEFDEAVQREARMMQQARDAGIVLAPVKQTPTIKLIRNDSGWFRRTFERSRKK